jgi:hypothetical protein
VAGDLLTSATVTPAAVMAEACREHAWFGGFAGPLGELDDGIDQLLPVEQGGVVVVGARDLDDARLPRQLLPRPRGFARVARLSAGAVHDRRRHLHARELVGERVAVAKQGPAQAEGTR